MMCFVSLDPAAVVNAAVIMYSPVATYEFVGLFCLVEDNNVSTWCARSVCKITYQRAIY